MTFKQTHGFCPKVRNRVRECISSLRLVNMLEKAPEVRFRKDGSWTISKRASTFKRANKFNKNYGMLSI